MDFFARIALGRVDGRYHASTTVQGVAIRVTDHTTLDGLFARLGELVAHALLCPEGRTELHAGASDDTEVNDARAFVT